MAIEMIAEKNWAEDLRKELQPLSLTNEEEEIWARQSIFKVPSRFKSGNIKAYEPQLISIGPYHNGKPNLKPMEHHKKRALAKLLDRSKIPIEQYVAALEDVVQELMDSYGDLDDEWRDPDRFLEMMVVDAGFMVEVLVMFMSIAFGYYSPMDPVFSVHGILNSFTYLVPDLLMLENQIPMLAIARMIALESRLSSPQEAELLANSLAANLLWGQVPNANMSELGAAAGLNMLDLFRKQMIPDPYAHIPFTPELDLKKRQTVRSATELQDAGVGFRRSGTASLNDITFQNGILKMPVFGIENTGEVLFCNAMALERLRPSTGHDVRTYMFFMFGLINSVEDVKLLKSEGLIESRLGSDEQVAELIKRLAKDVFFDPCSRLCIVRNSLNEYYEISMMKWSRRVRDWRRNLMRTYFSSPWSFISLVAAALLLCLTLIQTYYTVKSYTTNKN